MKNTNARPVAFRRLALLSLCAAYPLQAQGGKEALQWLKEYSPNTGYWIINEFETKANKPGVHKQFLDNTSAPVTGTAVHEVCHMLNGHNSNGSTTFAYHVGNKTMAKVTPGFKPFLSSEIAVDIPATFRNGNTELYIMSGSSTFSVAYGLYGIWEEWSAYITDLASDVDMVPCFKANFNNAAAWNALNGDAHSTTMATAQFRYFSLRYVMFAKKSHPDIYEKILASAATKTTYTQLVTYAELASKEWEAAMKSVGRDTRTDYGWDEYWKFWNEIQKPEYKDLEKLLLNPTVTIAPRFPDSPARPAWMLGHDVSLSIYDLRGGLVHAMTLRADAPSNRNLWSDWSRRFNPENHILRISNGKHFLTGKLDAFPSLMH